MFSQAFCHSVQGGGGLPAHGIMGMQTQPHSPPSPSHTDTTGYGQQAGGTHSNGMHTCLMKDLSQKFFTHIFIQMTQSTYQTWKLRMRRNHQRNKQTRPQNLNFRQLFTIMKMPNLALAVEDVKMTMTTTKVLKSNYTSQLKISYDDCIFRIRSRKLTTIH